MQARPPILRPKIHPKGYHNHGQKGEDALKRTQHPLQRQTLKPHRFAVRLRDQTLHRLWTRILPQWKFVLLPTKNKDADRGTGQVYHAPDPQRIGLPPQE